MHMFHMINLEGGEAAKDSPPPNTEATDDAPVATAVAVATKRGATRLPPNRTLSTAAASATGNGSALASSMMHDFNLSMHEYR